MANFAVNCSFLFPKFVFCYWKNLGRQAGTSSAREMSNNKPMIRFVSLFTLLLAFNISSLCAQNIQCTELSKEVDSFINTLKKENYKIDLINTGNQLIFQTEKKFSQIKFENLKGFYAKCKTELKDGMHVRFSVYEICLNDSNEAKTYEAKINAIINGNDLINEKNYDFIIRNKNKLIYITN